MIVKIKSKGHAFTIPVPYAVLRMRSGILTSKFVMGKIKDWLKKHDGQPDEHSDMKDDVHSASSRFGNELVLSILENPSTKQALRQLIEELQCCEGTVLVDVQAQDGTEVLVKL